MATINYIVNTDSPNSIPGVETFSQKDLQLLNTFEINSTFNTTQHTVELHITDLFGNILTSDYNYINYKLLGNAQSADTSGARIITVNPLDDIKSYGFETGGVKLLYHLYDNVYSTDRSKVEFFIDSISPDRTELLLDSLQIPQERIESVTLQLKERLNSTSYFQEYRLNFENNDLFIVTNIELLQVGASKKVAVKLYEPLPSIYSERDILSLIELVGDSFAFEITSTVELEQPTIPTLREANFNIDTVDANLTPSSYLNYDELFSYNIGSSTNEIFSKLGQVGVNVSIDHTDYSNFIYFSSAEERLLNFKYKLELLESYNANIQALEQGTAQSISGSLTYYKGLVEGVLRNFDHYDSYLYYESGSSAWPKTNSQKPYINATVNSSEGITWFSQQRAIASAYDKSNLASLENTIPNYLRDDEANANYITFVSMIGQHFDTLWLYAKSVTDKYSGDNRLDFGISKDLVEEALRNFGVKIYNSSKSSEDLFNSLFSQTYSSGSELITNYITGSLTGSNTPIFSTSFDNYQKEVYKRLYHNLSYLVKTKGTERGVRALINCFGIPSDILTLKLYGGQDTQDLPSLGDFTYFTGSLDKIRLENTGSITTGSTLSQYTSIVKSEKRYTDDLHNVEIGFSPATDIDRFIIQNLPGTFNLDKYLGDPRNSSKDSYEGLSQITVPILEQLNTYNTQDYVRLIKFFDNVLFKLVKDFLPARANIDTGIIIKPHILQRSKAKQVELQVSESLETGSIDTAFITGSSGDSFGGRDQYRTRYIKTVQTPTGISEQFYHDFEQPKYDGEFSGSNLTVIQGELGANNPYVITDPTPFPGLFNLWVNDNNICILFTQSLSPPLNQESGTVFKDGNTYYIRPGSSPDTNFFTGTGGATFKILSASVEQSINFPHHFTSSVTPTLGTTSSSFSQYDTFIISASKADTGGACENFVSGVFGACNILQGTPPLNLGLNIPYNIKQWFITSSINTQSQVFIYEKTGSATSFTVLPNFNGVSPSTASLESASFNTPAYSNGDQIQVVLIDVGLGNTCKIDITRNILSCLLQVRTIYSGSAFNAFEDDSSPSKLYLNNPLALLEEPGYERQGLASFFNGVATSGTPLTEYHVYYRKGKFINPAFGTIVSASFTGTFNIPGDLEGQQTSVNWNFTSQSEGRYIANLENIFNIANFPGISTTDLSLWIWAKNPGTQCQAGPLVIYGSNPLDPVETPPTPQDPPDQPNAFVVQTGSGETLQQIEVQYNSSYNIGNSVLLSDVGGCWTIISEAFTPFLPTTTITGTC